MKILCEVPLGVNQSAKSQIRWLRGHENYLFAFENERKLRVFSIKQEAGAAREIQSASLAESRHCSCLAWNRDESLLALVVDRKQIYFWDVKRNQFSQFKPRCVQSDSVDGPRTAGGAGPAPHRKAKLLDIEFVAWSKVSDKLAVCYASGQILLCHVTPAAAADKADRADRADRADKQQQQPQQQRSFTTSSEHFIDNSESLLKRIVSIEVCEFAELFACSSVICEILVMSFDGQTKLYCQGESLNPTKLKFSPVHRKYSPQTGKYLGQSVHLACQSGSEKGLYLKQIALDTEQRFQDIPPRLYMPKRQASADGRQPAGAPPQPKLVNFHWLSPVHLLFCLESGSVQLIEIVHHPLKQEDSASVTCTELFKIGHERVSFESGLASPSSALSRSSSRNLSRPNESEVASLASDRSLGSPDDNLSRLTVRTNGEPESNPFRLFELIRMSKKSPESGGPCFALAFATKFKLFYFEVHEAKLVGGQKSGANRYVFEHLDDIDLSDSLQRVSLALERASWSSDCSMLALQVTSGHLLVYKTRLQSFMVVSHGPRTAYLSSPNEVTVLNYGMPTCDKGSLSPDELQAGERSASPTSDIGSQADSQALSSRQNAIILSIQLKPSLLAIGPNHLAVALNNRVRFYLLDARTKAPMDRPDAEGQSLPLFHEQEYITIVVGICLSGRFVAVQFDDGRLKLQAIGRAQGQDNGSTDQVPEDERVFPDPSQPESITAFTLTEELLVYCTHEGRVKVFGLAGWRMMQVCEYGHLFVGPVLRLKPNERGNKFVCLVDPTRSKTQENVFLYDLYSNSVSAILPNKLKDSLWPRLVKAQLATTSNILTFDPELVRKIARDFDPSAGFEPNRKGLIQDAIWDTDGRSLLLVESKAYHVIAVLCHTLHQEEPTAVYATSAKKPSSYSMLYITQGVVSYQTGSGRVMNSILETHDDDLKLTRLETQIQAVKLKCVLTSGRDTHSGDGADESDQDDVSLPAQKAGDSHTSSMSLIEAYLRITMLKLDYLCTILPMYSLPKCRDICKHLMEEESFNIVPDGAEGPYKSEYGLINELLPKVLASWSLFTLNLNFASQVYKRNNMQVYDELLQGLLDDLKTKKAESRLMVNNRILAILFQQSTR